MARRPRLDHPGALHHVYARGHARQSLYLDDTDRRRFLAIVRRVFREEGVRCLVWALMPNHYHFLVETGSAPISLVFQRINTRYGMHFNRRHERVGYVFQGRFGSKRVDSEPYLLRLIAYVLVNPVQANVISDVDALATYPWTAYPELLGRCRWPFVDVDGVLSLFGGDGPRATAALRASLASTPGTDAALEPAVEVAARVQAAARVFGVEGACGRIEFLDRVVRELDARAVRRMSLELRGWTLGALVTTACRRVSADADAVRG